MRDIKHFKASNVRGKTTNSFFKKTINNESKEQLSQQKQVSKTKKNKKLEFIEPKQLNVEFLLKRQQMIEDVQKKIDKVSTLDPYKIKPIKLRPINIQKINQDGM